LCFYFCAISLAGSCLAISTTAFTLIRFFASASSHKYLHSPSSLRAVVSCQFSNLNHHHHLAAGGLCVMKYYVATQIVNPNAGPLTLTSDSPGLSARSASSQIVIQLRSLRRKTKVAYAQDACRLRISSRPRLHIVGYPFRNSPNRSNGSGCTVHRPSHKRPTRDSLRTAC
jgi:hypothetical protein